MKSYFRNWASLEYYRILYNAVAILSFSGVFYFFVKAEKQQLFDVFLIEIIGYCLLIIGIVFLIIALKSYDLGEFSGTRQLSEGKEKIVGKLNISGMNSKIRHPLYFASLLVFWGLFLVFPHDAMLLMAIVSTLYLLIGIRLEEQKLIEDFGESYLEYQKSVPMLLPNFFKRKRNQTT